MVGPYSLKETYKGGRDTDGKARRPCKATHHSPAVLCYCLLRLVRRFRSVPPRELADDADPTWRRDFLHQGCAAPTRAGLDFLQTEGFCTQFFFAGRESGSQGLCDAPSVSFSPFSFNLVGVRDTSVSAFAVVGPGCSLQLGWPGYFSYFFVKQLQPLRWSVHPTPGKVSHVWPKPL